MRASIVPNNGMVIYEMKLKASIAILKHVFWQLAIGAQKLWISHE